MEQMNSLKKTHGHFTTDSGKKITEINQGKLQKIIESKQILTD